MSRGFPHPRRASQAPAVEFELLLIDGDNLLHRVRGTRDEAGLRWLLPRLRAWLPAGAQIIVMLDGHPGPGDVLRRRVAPGIEFQHSGNVDGDTALLTVLAARPYADRARTLLVTDDHALTDRARHEGGLTRRLEWLTVQLARATGLPAAGQSATGMRPHPRRGVGSGAGGSGAASQSARGMESRTGSGAAGSSAASQSARGMSLGDPGPPSPGMGSGAGVPGGPPVGIGRGRSVRRTEGPPEPPEDRKVWRPGRGATRKVGNPKRGHPS
jgi:hypothetical protein